LERIRNEKAEQAKEEEQLLGLLQGQLDGHESEVRKQREDMEKLDQHIQGLRGQRQDVKDRTLLAQNLLAEYTASIKASKEEAQKLEAELASLGSELKATEAAASSAKKEASASAFQKPQSRTTEKARNPFGEGAPLHFDSPAPGGKPAEARDIPDFFGAEFFPPPAPAPAPQVGWDLQPQGGAPPMQDNFFDAAISSDLDVTETKDSFGGPTPGTTSPFDTFDFSTFAGTPPSSNTDPDALGFGVVEVKDPSAHSGFFGDDNFL